MSEVAPPVTNDAARLAMPCGRAAAAGDGGWRTRHRFDQSRALAAVAGQQSAGDRLDVVLGIGLLGWYYVRRTRNQRRRAKALNLHREARREAKCLCRRSDGSSRRLALRRQSALGAASWARSRRNHRQRTFRKPGCGRPRVRPWIRGAAGGEVRPSRLDLERKLSGPAYSRHGDSSMRSAMPPASSPSVGASTAGRQRAEHPCPRATRQAARSIGLLKPSTTPAALARGAADAAAAAAERRLHRLHARDRDRLHAAGHDDLRDRDRHLQCRRHGGAARARHKLVGETSGEVQQGSARVFVLWTEARTPTGVVIPLASPGTDELGRSGLQGKVNRHFFERFGAAILISVIDGAVQGAAQSLGRRRHRDLQPFDLADVMTEVLKSTVNIPPTVTKRNGDRIQVLVARDLDFRTVYELKPRQHELARLGGGIDAISPRESVRTRADAARIAAAPGGSGGHGALHQPPGRSVRRDFGRAGGGKRCHSPTSSGAGGSPSWSQTPLASASMRNRRCCRRRCRAGSASRSSCRRRRARTVWPSRSGARRIRCGRSTS